MTKTESGVLNGGMIGQPSRRISFYDVGVGLMATHIYQTWKRSAMIAERRADRPGRPPRPRSAFDCEVINAVLLPALVVVLGAERFLLSVADCFDAIGGNSLLH